ncbi:metallophosphoesterase [Capnocytophaga canimorsus]|uniref:metallophosphoesterase n=1 Tax=Capnocytophaga canimorsus TaxID=28188 RepID=UPI00385DBBFD
MNRRKFIKKTALATIGLGLLGGGYAWQIEPFWLEFVRLKMPIKNLPNSLIGKTLMQISDLHVGHRVSTDFLIDALRKAQNFQPDFVVYTGDYITLHQRKVLYDELNKVLENSVKGTLGTTAILGNHDYGHHWREPHIADEITQLIESKNIKVLRNESVEIQGLHFIGFDDYWAGTLDAQKALKNYSPEKANIVLCHNPDVCDLEVWQSFKGWILSGHTHGGQCKPPFLPAPILPVKNKKYASGKIELSDERTLYINRALGHSLQVRFNVRPEITIFELEKA